MEKQLSEPERIQTWKHNNEEKILRQWNKKNQHFFLISALMLWGVALVYILIYDFDISLTSNFYFYFTLVYPLLIWFYYRKKVDAILHKRRKQKGIQKTEF